MLHPDLLKHPEAILVLRLLCRKDALLAILDKELEDDTDHDFCQDIYDDLDKISVSLRKAREYIARL